MLCAVHVGRRHVTSVHSQLLEMRVLNGCWVAGCQTPHTTANY